MKPEEAIEELNHELLIRECFIEELNSFICDCDVDDDEYDDEKEQCEISLTRYKKEKEVIEMAISAIKEIEQYREIGTVEECRRSVEKQNPTKPEIYTDTVQTINGSFQRDVFECPVCGEYICNAEDEIPRYCCSCGQKLEECEGE